MHDPDVTPAEINIKNWNHRIQRDQQCLFGFTTNRDEDIIIISCRTCGNQQLGIVGLFENRWHELRDHPLTDGALYPEPAAVRICLQHMDDIARRQQARRQIRRFLGLEQPHGQISTSLPETVQQHLDAAATAQRQAAAAED